MKTIKTYKGFGNSQVVDVSNYQGRENEAPENTKRGNFIIFGFLDLNKYYLPNGEPNFSHADLLNIAIREKQNKDNAHKRIARDYKRKGWSYVPFPLQVDIKTGKPKNGRTRIRAALLNGETCIPCAYFDYTEDNKVSGHVQELSEGLIGNDGLVSRVTRFEDLVEAGISACKHGEVNEDRVSILNLLANEFEASRFVDETEFSDIADMVLDAVNDGQDAMWMPERDEVIEYLKNSPDLPKDAVFASLDQDIPKGKKRVFVYSAPSQSNKGRLWGNIAHEIPQGSYVALYTTKKFPSKMKKDYVEFMEYQDWRYEECFEIVSLSIQGVTLEAPKDRPWELIGVIPQINNNEHNNKRNYNRLVKLNELK
tara:strand:- start:62 stop:1165 length:1104 start_codon:yes stop_codon:yes gene_type:complete